MGEFRDLLDRERRRFTMPEGSIDDLERRRDRKRRNHRISTSDGGRTWKKQYGGPLKVAQIQFFDDQDGWAVADDGKGLLRTVDGGVTWKFVSDHALSPMESSLQFASPLIGWAVDPSNGRV